MGVRVSRVVLTGLLVAAPAAFGQPQISAVRYVTIDGAFPSYLTHAPGDPTREYVALREGVVRVVRNGTLLDTPFLTLPDTTQNGENGLLSMAFDPAYQTNGFFYVFQSRAGGPVVARYRAASPEVADPASGVDIIRMEPSEIHVGGWIGFGPDGLLYVSRGDGGNCALAMNPVSRQGKILRLDVRSDAFPADPARNYAVPAANPFAGGGGAPEVWALGLRNPYRCSFDRQTGDFYIADVGSGSREEVNRVAAATPGGMNFGWPCREGRLATPTQCPAQSCPDGAAYTDPIIDFDRGQSACIIGGYVYRGCEVPALRGEYVFGSCNTPRVFSFRPADPAGTLRERTTELGAAPVVSWGEDALGELYALRAPAAVERVVAAGAPAPDCNRNRRADGCDIAGGISRDANGDGVPDECACRADFDRSGAVTVSDIFAYLAAFFANEPRADLNGGGVEVSDIFAFLSAYFAGC